MSKELTKDVLTPNQLDFLDKYLSDKSKTRGNAYRSAIDSGYSKNSAQNMKRDIQNRKWYMNTLKNLNPVDIRQEIRDNLALVIKSLQDIKLRDKLQISEVTINNAFKLLAQIEKMLETNIKIEGKYTIDDSDEIEVILGNDVEKQLETFPEVKEKQDEL